MSSKRRGTNWATPWRGPLLALLVLAAALTVAACGGDDGIGKDDGEVEVATAEAEGEPSGNLTISNWAFYIDPKTIKEFEQETGISVNYVEEVNSSEEFFGKVQPQLANGESGGRSLIIAADWLAKRMYDLGYLQKLDKDALAPAFENLKPAFEDSAEDPERDFTIPWQGGMTGLIVDKSKAPDVTSINDLFDPKYKGKVVMVTELTDAPVLVMKADGVDPEEATEEDWLAAIDKIKQAADSGQIRRFAGGDYLRDLSSGDAIAAIGWGGDAVQLQADNPNIEFVMPEDGCILWTDNWAIPVGAPNPTAAYEFINYVYQPENQAQIVGYVGSATPVEGVQELVANEDPELAESDLVFPDEEYTANCSPPISPPGDAEARKRVEQAWASVITG